MAMTTSLEDCINDDCIIQNSTFETNTQKIGYSDSFNIRMQVSDLTGTLDTCRMYGATADRILGIGLTQFLRLTDTERGKLKWQLLLERCKFKLSIKRKSALTRTVSISVLDCVVADTIEVLTNVQAY